MSEEQKSTKEKGDEGEELAATFLEEKGYSILHKKWKHGRYDLDLIAENKTHIVFVEVKTRYSNAYGEPWEAVNKTKRKKICISADAFLQNYTGKKEPRFDIISILKMGRNTLIEHIDEAFYPMA